MYFEDKNNQANKYTLSFNLLNLIILIITSLIFENQLYIITTTLLTIFLYLIFILIHESNKFKFSFHLFDFIKYESVDICDRFFFFLIYLFGISNAASYGQQYVAAMNFVALITDTQWDGFDAISTVAKIDIARGCFNYKTHRKNAYKLLGILMVTILLLFVIIYPFNELTLWLVLIYLSIEVYNFLIYPIYNIKAIFLQLEYSSFITTTNKVIASILRTLLSFLKTPFCTGIGQIASFIYQFTTINIMFNHIFMVDKIGRVVKK